MQTSFAERILSARSSLQHFISFSASSNEWMSSKKLSSSADVCARFRSIRCMSRLTEAICFNSSSYFSFFPMYSGFFFSSFSLISNNAISLSSFSTNSEIHSAVIAAGTGIPSIWHPDFTYSSIAFKISLSIFLILFGLYTSFKYSSGRYSSESSNIY